MPISGPYLHPRRHQYQTSQSFAWWAGKTSAGEAPPDAGMAETAPRRDSVNCEGGLSGRFPTGIASRIPHLRVHAPVHGGTESPAMPVPFRIRLGDHTDRRRVEIERLDTTSHESGASKCIVDLSGSPGRRLTGRAGTAWLRSDGDFAAGSQQASELLETGDGFGPKTHAVDGEDRVDGTPEVRQGVHGTDVQAHAAGADSGGVSPSGVAHHDFGVIDTENAATGRGTAQLRHRDPGSEADLEYPVGGLYVEQRDDPAIALKVRRAMGHDPTREMPAQAVWLHELADHDSEDPPLQRPRPTGGTPTAEPGRLLVRLLRAVGRHGEQSNNLKYA